MAPYLYQFAVRIVRTTVHPRMRSMILKYRLPEMNVSPQPGSRWFASPQEPQASQALSPSAVKPGRDEVKTSFAP
jgi:hypothetical protein